MVRLGQRKAETRATNKQAEVSGSNAEASTSWLCEALAALVQPDSKFFPWRWGSKIHYRQLGNGGKKILLVHGFGVGAHQYSSLLPLLSDTHQVWALDLLGQGLSWPHREALEEEELRLSIDTWTDLLADFITDVIQEPCYVVGNSLGGYLAAQLAATRQHLCRGVVYLNATPFWAFMPRPDTQELTGRLLRWLVRYDGVMPAPEGLKRIIRSLWWDRFTTEDTVSGILKQVYPLRTADEKLLTNILAATQHELAVDAMVSIIFSPGTVQRFGELAADAPCPSCLIYGQHDPWVRPVWGQRLKRFVPHATYFEIPAGHCPHDEAPAAVHWCLTDWIASVEEGRPVSLKVGEEAVIKSEDGESIVVRHVSGQGQTILERFVEALHRLEVKQPSRQYPGTL
ncbi:probable 2-hydroxy-6-oxononadienedioate/2-hydroxy-6-oxononatrienedioate hydrolase [Coccomyxa sp. Obi]|nr:probable 2-hydroxy-6-oxononadienedioate/2-hydroxy-6-oxononatrienedioate hydrolase [Coccomyxa sp. Obi]